MNEKYRSKMHSDSRLVKLEPTDPEKAGKSLVDPKLYKGGNSIRIMLDPETTMWSFKYEHGGLPPALLGQNFTRYTDALSFVSRYYARNGLKVVEVVDQWASA